MIESHEEMSGKRIMKLIYPNDEAFIYADN